MANKKKKLISSQQQETPNRVILSNNKKVCNDDSEGELSNSVFLHCDTILYDILTRVPIDSLMRFRCVCKLWSSLTVNNSEFINLHSCRQPYSNRGFIKLSENHSADDGDDDDDDKFSRLLGIYRCTGIVFFDIDKREEKTFRFRPESGLFDKKLFIIDSLNGLVLLGSYKESSGYHVYNPITGYSYELPFVEDRGDIYYFQLVLDSLTKKYKVLCLCVRLFRTGNQYFLKIITLGTGNDSWRDVGFPKMHPTHDNFSQVFAKGTFNWLTYENEILSIDINDEVFHTIKYPKGCSNRSKLLDIEGSLCFVDYTDNAIQVHNQEATSYKANLKIWSLKKDDEKKKNVHQHEWIEMYNIVDMFHNTIVPKDFIRSRFSPVIVAVIMNPTPKIIFGVSVHDIDGYGDINEYYCYDVKLERLDSLMNPYGMHYRWHVNSVARL